MNELANLSLFSNPTVFNIVWAVLYFLSIIAFAIFLLKTRKGNAPHWITRVFAANMLLNVLYMPIKFWLRSDALAFVALVLIIGTLVLLIKYFLKIHAFRVITALLFPYLVWVTFTAVVLISKF